jgi:hypothetical protein
MKILASLIKRRLEAQVAEWGHCAVYEHELQRLWPVNEKNRKAKIAKFAKEHGFRLSVYKPGLCAIFEREPRPQLVERLSEQNSLRKGSNIVPLALKNAHGSGNAFDAHL